MKIDEMEAGRELDRLVATQVMGLSFGLFSAGPQPYSSNIALAWQVVEHLAEVAGPVSVCWGEYGDHGNRASVVAMFASGSSVAETAPLAICRAALKAVMGGEG